MPIETHTTYNLTATERAAVLAVAPEGQSAEEYCTVNSVTQERLSEITANFVRSQMEGRYGALGTALTVAEIEGDAERLGRAAPHLEALKKIFGLE